MRFYLHMAKLYLRMALSRAAFALHVGPKLDPNLVPNPLLKYPRNLPCYCNSGRKFKYCHLHILPRTCLPSFADQANLLLKAAGLK